MLSQSIPAQQKFGHLALQQRLEALVRLNLQPRYTITARNGARIDAFDFARVSPHDPRPVAIDVCLYHVSAPSNSPPVGELHARDVSTADLAQLELVDLRLHANWRYASMQQTYEAMHIQHYQHLPDSQQQPHSCANLLMFLLHYLAHQYGFSHVKVDSATSAGSKLYRKLGYQPQGGQTGFLTSLSDIHAPGHHNSPSGLITTPKYVLREQMRCLT